MQLAVQYNIVFALSILMITDSCDFKQIVYKYIDGFTPSSVEMTECRP
jgi:hypothetical protein